MEKRRGFTLIELLMSIAIIAILSALVMGGLSTARGRSNDSKTKAQLVSLRTAAENYNTAYGSYGTATGCFSGMFATSEFNMSTYASETSYPSGTNLRCNANITNYAVSANLTGDGGYWCVDARGARRLDTDPGEVLVCQ